MPQEYTRLYDMNEVDLTREGKVIHQNIKNYFDEQIRSLIENNNIDPMDLSVLISSYAQEQCFMIAREQKMNRDIEEMYEDIQES